MLIQVVTLFPEMFAGMLDTSIIRRAQQRASVEIRLVDMRAFGLGLHRVADDYPFGGGPGMVLRADVLVPAVEAALAYSPRPARLVWMSPQGRRLHQDWCRQAAQNDHLVLVAGHYEGFDQRALDILGGEELSIGDFVLTGGELPAMVVVDSVVRLLPGVLGDPESARQDSFGETGPLLEGPQYTRPQVYRGHCVPDVLLSGHHAQIAAWRHQQSLQKTREQRPDLMLGNDLFSEN